MSVRVLPDFLINQIAAGEVVVQAEHLVPLFQEGLAQMGAKESGAAGDKDFLHSFKFGRQKYTFF